MLRQQLQHADELPHACAGTVPPFQTLAEFPKHGRQLPVTIHVRMIQSRRPTLQGGQIMQRIKHIIARVVTSSMDGHDAFIKHDFDVIFFT
jgi:hypothetical protein